MWSGPLSPPCWLPSTWFAWTLYGGEETRIAEQAPGLLRVWKTGRAIWTRIASGYVFGYVRHAVWVPGICFWGESQWGRGL